MRRITVTVKYKLFVNGAFKVHGAQYVLEKGERVADLLSYMEREDPALAGLLYNHETEHLYVACVVNSRFVQLDTILRDGDEVFVFPPVAGG